MVEQIISRFQYEFMQNALLLVSGCLSLGCNGGGIPGPSPDESYGDALPTLFFQVLP